MRRTRRAGVSREFAWLPKRLTSGRIVWMRYYWAVYKIVGVVSPRWWDRYKNNWVENTENLSEQEFFMQKLQK